MCMNYFGKCSNDTKSLILITNMTTKVFLDLEDTVITTFDDGVLLHDHLNALQWWLDNQNLREVSIFSFAIWNEKDKEEFVKIHKSVLERELNVKIVEWLSVDEMAKLSQEFSGIHWDRLDFMQLRGKHGAFIDVCKSREKDTTCILIDDAIPFETLTNHTQNLVIKLVPIHIAVDPINIFWDNGISH